jgi:Domain of unknown function (DUF397)
MMSGTRGPAAAAAAEPVWTVSSRCAGNGSCVEVAMRSGGVLVRDGKNPVPGALLSFTPGEWHGFVAAVKAGQLGLH